ncbi:carbonic anhydrase family protein [Nitrosovibrio sp. Nv17]|uniref:carbonic anhydrase family protein n=1 Tax=Nitrosovibrio sp. Nv17 TaxID=1855339 RepID=UPI0009085135|nr:carbonic anhydrase family protein [Nitrosovibrio sp. Nv17]SFW21388.1 carbonic anhydrase [Nitrosovibrio sp. Nv17]
MPKPSAWRLPRALLAYPFLFMSFAAQADILDDKLELMEQQSPIDIRSDNTTYAPTLPALTFNFSSSTALDVINNGSPGAESTVRANVLPGAGTLTTSGETWNLVQFHFHTPSEHLENSQATPLEMHLVFSDAADHLLVVGRWINYGATNVSLDPIFSQLPQTIDDHLAVNAFDLNTLLPADNLQSFRYTGSLTTPPFSEGVAWINLADPLYMSPGQIQEFQNLFPDGDARPIQPLNGRIILTDVPGFAQPVPEPETYAMLLGGLMLLGFMARRRASSGNPA